MCRHGVPSFHFVRWRLRMRLAKTWSASRRDSESGQHETRLLRPWKAAVQAHDIVCSCCRMCVCTVIKVGIFTYIGCPQTSPHIRMTPLCIMRRRLSRLVDLFHHRPRLVRKSLNSVQTAKERNMHGAAASDAARYIQQTQGKIHDSEAEHGSLGPGPAPSSCLALAIDTNCNKTAVLGCKGPPDRFKLRFQTVPHEPARRHVSDTVSWLSDRLQPPMTGPSKIRMASNLSKQQVIAFPPKTIASRCLRHASARSYPCPPGGRPIRNHATTNMTATILASTSNIQSLGPG